MDLFFSNFPLCYGSSNKIVLLNIKTNYSVLCLSFNNLVRYFELDPKTQGGNSSLRQCLIKGIVYKEIYKIIYLENYEGPNPLPYNEDNNLSDINNSTMWSLPWIHAYLCRKCIFRKILILVRI